MGTNSLVEYGLRRVIIAATVVICALLQIIDTTIANIALPTMQGSMDRVMFLVCGPFVIAVVRESKNSIDMPHGAGVTIVITLNF